MICEEAIYRQKGKSLLAELRDRQYLTACFSSSLFNLQQQLSNMDCKHGIGGLTMASSLAISSKIIQNLKRAGLSHMLMFL